MECHSLNNNIRSGLVISLCLNRNPFSLVPPGIASNFRHLVRACSHEPGTVNYPGVMIAPGQALPCVHMIICCPWALLLRANFIAPGQAQGHLIATKLSKFLYFLHKLLQRMNFKHVYLFLVLSGTLYWKIYSKH